MQFSQQIEKLATAHIFVLQTQQNEQALTGIGQYQGYEHDTQHEGTAARGVRPVPTPASL